ncbi:hypothetical protein [Paraconexibacter sp. AEG42_29]
MAKFLRKALRVVADMPADRPPRQAFLIDGWTDKQAEAIEQTGADYPVDLVVELAFHDHLARRRESFALVA